ncbi:hypothetical protein DBR32_14240 [Taibaiella sp. KBW10]|uniref:type VI secretion system TssO n=1 Tax=Taibaiella sp. KBW10 TaxID=2153357 RepID=UPI000F5A6D09|nr:type VI secretion system TssO [Taibaiella sp. KBW10]RQO29742.1 hypothetical protein DBR32_14240 [Taibaiella sp. KBW10]
MQGYHSLSKQERRYQFFYLLGLLALVLLVLSLLFLRKFDSPFARDGALSLQMLEQRNKFTARQAAVSPLVENTFRKIIVLSKDSVQPFVESDIKTSINEVANAFEGVEIYDSRKEDYYQIAQFMKMYFSDKVLVAKKTENIARFEKELNECLSGFKDNQQRLSQMKNAMLSRSAK